MKRMYFSDYLVLSKSKFPQGRIPLNPGNKYRTRLFFEEYIPLLKDMTREDFAAWVKANSRGKLKPVESHLDFIFKGMKTPATTWEEYFVKSSMEPSEVHYTGSETLSELNRKIKDCSVLFALEQVSMPGSVNSFEHVDSTTLKRYFKGSFAYALSEINVISCIKGNAKSLKPLSLLHWRFNKGLVSLSSDLRYTFMIDEAVWDADISEDLLDGFYLGREFGDKRIQLETEIEKFRQKYHEEYDFIERMDGENLDLSLFFKEKFNLFFKTQKIASRFSGVGCAFLGTKDYCVDEVLTHQDTTLKIQNIFDPGLWVNEFEPCFREVQGLLKLFFAGDWEHLGVPAPSQEPRDRHWEPLFYSPVGLSIYENATGLTHLNFINF